MDKGQMQRQRDEIWTEDICTEGRRNGMRDRGMRSGQMNGESV